MESSEVPVSQTVEARAEGGFLLPSLPSPPLSTISPASQHSSLPRPRQSPLKPGSKAESRLRTYLDAGLLNVSRKFAKKFTEGGYRDVKSIVTDLEKLVDLLWVSSTPWLQIQYLLQIANSFNDYIASFTPDPKSMFALLDKLDRCFYALITGQSASPLSSPISPSIASHQLTTTEKVRLKSIIERTRLHIVKILEDGPLIEAEGDVENPLDPAPANSERGFTPATDTNEAASEVQDEQDNEEDEDEYEWEMEAARVYERSLVEVGAQLQRVE